jgi:hypothetical protein
VLVVAPWSGPKQCGRGERDLILTRLKNEFLLENSKKCCKNMSVGGNSGHLQGKEENSLLQILSSAFLYLELIFFHFLAMWPFLENSFVT